MPPMFENMNVKLVTVLSAASACAAILIALTWGYASLKSEMQAMSKALEDSYTLSRASEVALREAIANPGFNKVDPRDPQRVFSVGRGGNGIINSPDGR